jgi:hypothetical protein
VEMAADPHVSTPRLQPRFTTFTKYNIAKSSTGESGVKESRNTAGKRMWMYSVGKSKQTFLPCFM